MLVPAFVLGTFEKLLNYVMFTDTLTSPSWHRRSSCSEGGGIGQGAFAMIGYPFLPAVYMLCLLGIAARVFTLEPLLAVTGTVIFLTGWPLFRLGHRLFGAPERIAQGTER